ncbi:hypothetical protein FDN13_04495 [Caloramator sp. E03]|uniref:hypothetical protein n=1 Tax=Caloramator sp. E03 TaxID=2576307 RepID=UPI00111050BA|nr:hypothetical protein [Caloramator sp. E03]QCX33029.1 hypothetical protein FDN13_04495 [Caloramator sp. E03]
MERTYIILKILDYVKDKNKIGYDEILRYFQRRNNMNNLIIELNDCIFDLIIEGILKIGIVYSYDSCSCEYFIDKEKLMTKMSYENSIAS